MILNREPIIFFIITVFTLLHILILYIHGYTPYPDCRGYMELTQDRVRRYSPYPTTEYVKERPIIWNLDAINDTALSLRKSKSIMPPLLIYSFMKGNAAATLYGITKKRLKPILHLSPLFFMKNERPPSSILCPGNHTENTHTLAYKARRDSFSHNFHYIRHSNRYRLFRTHL